MAANGIALNLRGRFRKIYLWSLFKKKFEFDTSGNGYE